MPSIPPIIVDEAGNLILTGAENLGKNVVEDVAKPALGWFERNILRRGEEKLAKEAEKKAALEAIAKGESAVVKQTETGAARAAKIANRAAAKTYKQQFKELNPTWLQSLSPWTRRAVIAAPVLGGAYGAMKYFGGGSAPSTNIDYSGWNLSPTVGGTTGSSILDDYLNQQRAQVEKTYGAMNVSVPGQEIYDPLSKISAQLGAASSGAMSDLANQYAQAAGSIKQGGQQGAASINDIYGAGAANMESVASQAGGQYGGMIPVSGAAATAPAEQVAAGKDLANYLAQNQLISAQTQGGMAELAQMLGPAYANQYALIDAQMRAQAEAQKALKEAQMRQQLQLEKAGALSDIAMKGIDYNYQKALENETLGKAINQLATPETIRNLAGQYEKLNESDRAFYANNYGIQSAEDYVRFKLSSMAQYGK